MSDSIFSDLSKSVAESLKGRNGEVLDSLKKKMVEEVLAKRVTILSWAFSRRKELDGKSRSLQEGDIKHFDANGVVVSSLFSKERLENKKQAEQELKKFDEALDKAMNEANWDSLEKLMPNGGAKQ